MNLAKFKNCDNLDTSLLSFDGEKWTREIIETLDDEKWLCETFKSREIWKTQLTVVRNLRKER